MLSDWLPLCMVSSEQRLFLANRSSLRHWSHDVYQGHGKRMVKRRVVVWSTCRLHRVGKKGACTLLTALPTPYQSCWLSVKVITQPTTCLLSFVSADCPIFFRCADCLSNQWECEILRFQADSIFSLSHEV